MAIYRKGEASLAADGTATGYGTNWKDQLALVRIGATVVFLNGNAIGAIATVSAIVSETQLQTIQSDGAVVARGKYFILLHDSLTVDGLAQNVAETLRYYQSSETEIADALDYFRTFDWERFEKVASDVKKNAAAAKVSETNAKTSETNSKASENASKANKEASDASAAAAKISENNSKASETNSKASENAANGSKVAAAGSATAADNSAKAGAASQAAAKTSETNAKTSETNAKASENSSLQSKNAAAGSATAAKTSETNSKTSETNSKTSETRAKTSETNAKTSETNAENWAKSVNPANLAQLDSENTFQKKQTFNTGATFNVSYTDSALFQGVSPTLKFRETDKPSGAPDYALVFDGGNFRLQKEVGSGENIFQFNYGSDIFIINKRLQLGTQKLEISQGGTGSNSASGARDNLELGLNSRPEFSAVYARDGIEVRTLSDSTNPAASLVSRRAKANGDTIASSEMRANANGSVEWIKRDSAGSPRGILLTEDNYVQFNGLTPAPANMELGIKNPNVTSYIDLHYGAKYDYDARIVCDGMNSDQVGGGNLRLNAGFLQLNSKGSTNITGGRLTVNTSDVVFDTQVGLAGGNLQVPQAPNATTVIGAGTRGIQAGADTADFNNASNINLYSWFGIGFCTSYTSPTNGVIQGKPAVFINTRTGTLNAKGAVQANGVTLTSDWNAKEDISIIDPDDAMAMMVKLDGWKFRYKLNDSGRMTAGIIAQDLDLVIPDLVIKPEPTPEVDIDGNVIIDQETGEPVNDGDSNLTADYMGLIGYMVAAIKSAGMKNAALQDEVDELRKDVEELKSLVAALTGK